jgi:hypothetical protein
MYAAIASVGVLMQMYGTTFSLLHCMPATPTDCALCADGYSMTVGHKCTACDGGALAAIYTSFAVVVALCVAVLALIAVQLLGLGDGQDAVANFTTFGCLNKVASLPWDKLRITVVAFQIVTQLVNIARLPLPDVYSKFLAWVALLNLDVGWLLSLGCVPKVDFYQRLLITTLGPIAASALLMCTYVSVRSRHKVQAVNTYTSQHAITPARTLKLEKLLAKHELVFLAMTFLIYSTVSTTVIQTFSCDTIDDYDFIKTRYLQYTV